MARPRLGVRWPSTALAGLKSARGLAHSKTWRRVERFMGMVADVSAVALATAENRMRGRHPFYILSLEIGFIG